MLCAALAVADGAAWLAVAALPVLACGLVLYGFVAASFDVAELSRARGDRWVAGGALPIAALAAGTIASAARTARAPAALHAPLGTLSLVLWALSMGWLAPPVLAEIARPRMRFDARRWSTVLPCGMYAAMTFVVGREEGVGWIVSFACAWTPVAVAVWGVVCLATALRAIRVAIRTGRHGRERSSGSDRLEQLPDTHSKLRRGSFADGLARDTRTRRVSAR
jgi:voltage-gated anion channel